MSVGSTGHSYISNAAFQAWVQEKTGQLYDNMAEQMDITNKRSEMAEDLGHARAKLQDLQESECGAMAKELEETLKKYEGTPDYETMKASLQPVIDKLNSAAVIQEKLKTAGQNTNGTKVDGSGAVVGTGGQAYVSMNAFYNDTCKPTEGRIKGWQEEIQTGIDKLGRQDQAAMIQIGDLNSRIHQTEQIAASLMQTANQAAMNIIQKI